MIHHRRTVRAALVAMWAVLYLPPLLAGRTLPARDVAATQIPWRTEWKAQVAAGHLPIWDPLSNQGRMLLANPNAMAAYPGTALFLFMSPERAAAWHLALHHLLILLGFEFLATRAGASPGSSLVAATAVGTSGLVFSQLTFMNAQASLAWAPWALGLALPPAGGGRGAGASDRPIVPGALLGLSFLGGEPVVAALAALAWAVVTVATRPGERVRRIVVAGTAALLVAAPVLAPLAVSYHETLRGALGVRAGALGADTLAPRRLLELLFPNLLGAPLGDARHGFWAYQTFGWQRYEPLIFPGTLVLLTLPCAARGRGRPGVWWGLVVVGVAASAAVAIPGLARLAVRVPVLGAGRFGIKFLLLALLGATPLVAAGWDALSGRWRQVRRRVGLATLLGLGAALVPALLPGTILKPLLGDLYPASRDDLAAVPSGRLGATLGADLACLAAPVAALGVAGAAPLPAALVAFAANGIMARGVLRFDRADRWAAPPAVVAALQGRGPVAALASSATGDDSSVPADLVRFWRARNAAVPSYGTRWGLGYVLAKGPDGLEPVREELVAEASEGAPLADRARLASALGAGSVVLPDDAPLSGDVAVGGALVRFADAPPPLAYLARRLLPAEGMVATLNTLSGTSFQPGVDAVVEGRAPAAELTGGTVVRLAGAPYALRFHTASAGPGLLVVRQSVMDCWRARVDGIPTSVETVNGCQMGVRVPPGEHEVSLAVDLLPYRVGMGGPLVLLAFAVGWRRLRRVGGDRAGLRLA